LAFKILVATNTQWKSWYTAKNSLFQQTFYKKLYHFNRNSQLGSVL